MENEVQGDKPEDESPTNQCANPESGEDGIVREEAIEVTKATLNEALGTVVYPLTRSLAEVQEHGIRKLKQFVRDRRKKRLADASKEVIDKIRTDATSNPEKLVVVEKLHKAFEAASESELESDDVLKLWSAVLRKIQEGDPDSDLLVEKLRSLSPSEAEFLLKFDEYSRFGLRVNPVLKAIAFGHPPRDLERQRLQLIAELLTSKGIVEQPFSAVRAIFIVLFPILVALFAAEINRSLFETWDVNVSSANNVVLFAVAGAFVGIMSLVMLRPRITLTWIGQKLLKGALRIYAPQTKT